MTTKRDEPSTTTPTTGAVEAASGADGRYCTHHDDDPAHTKECYTPNTDIAAEIAHAMSYCGPERAVDGAEGVTTYIFGFDLSKAIRIISRYTAQQPEVESYFMETDFDWKIDALSHFCSKCGQGDKRLPCHYCALCGGPMVWKKDEGRKTYAEMCAEIERLKTEVERLAAENNDLVRLAAMSMTEARADAIQEAIEAADNLRLVWQTSGRTDSVIAAGLIIAAPEQLKGEGS